MTAGNVFTVSSAPAKTDSRESLAAFMQTLQKRNGIEHINLVDFMRKGKNISKCILRTVLHTFHAQNTLCSIFTFS